MNFALSFLLALIFGAAVSNATVANFTVEDGNPNVSHNTLSKEATLARHFQDDWGNHYYLTWGVHGSVRGHLDSTLCPTTQSALGKEVGGKLYLVVDATQLGECVGGMIIADRQGDGWIGEWHSPATGAPTPLTLGRAN
jgi:hypothetical protein